MEGGTVGQIRHGSATTTHAVRAAIQRSEASAAELSRSCGINPKTVLKWRKRATVEDRRTGPREPRSTVLSEEEEAIIVAFRRHTLLPLDDCLYALQPTLPRLTRSSLHRCLQRHGISRLPDMDGEKPARKKFKAYAIGYFHIDLAEVQTAEGKLYLYVAIDRTSKFAFVQLVERATTRTASDFLEALVAAVPCEIHTVLTHSHGLQANHCRTMDNGIQFADIPKNRSGPTARFRGHPFDRTCWRHGIEHRLTKPRHPWTNGQVERMNRTIKDATVKRYHYDSQDQLRSHLGNFIAAYNFARRLKTLRGLTPYEFICKTWTSEPERFTIDPIHQMPGLNN
jgi:transposase InsO family protein